MRALPIEIQSDFHPSIDGPKEAMTPAPVRNHWNIASFWSSNAVMHQCAWCLGCFGLLRLFLNSVCHWGLVLGDVTFHTFPTPDFTFSNCCRAIRKMWLYPSELATLLVGWIKIILFYYIMFYLHNSIYYTNVAITMLQQFGRLVEVKRSRHDPAGCVSPSWGHWNENGNSWTSTSET